MDVEFDPAKRKAILDARKLDMADAGKVFDGATLTVEDDRKDYGEQRYITVGRLGGRMVWTPRGEVRRIISLRKANGKEQKAYGPRLR
jgi:uncharacterized DUF497 family protein